MPSPDSSSSSSSVVDSRDVTAAAATDTQRDISGGGSRDATMATAHESLLTREDILGMNYRELQRHCKTFKMKANSTKKVLQEALLQLVDKVN